MGLPRRSADALRWAAQERDALKADGWAETRVCAYAMVPVREAFRI